MRVEATAFEELDRHAPGHSSGLTVSSWKQGSLQLATSTCVRDPPQLGGDSVDNHRSTLVKQTRLSPRPHFPRF